MLNTVGRMFDSDLNTLVEIGFDEAQKICTQILKINVAPIGKGLILVPLGASQQKKSANKTVDHDSDSDGELVEDESDDEKVEDESAISASLHTEESDVVATAAHDTARYSALCEDYDNVVQEAAETSIPSLRPTQPPQNF